MNMVVVFYSPLDVVLYSINRFYPFSTDYTILLNLFRSIQSAPAGQLVVFLPAFFCTPLREIINSISPFQIHTVYFLGGGKKKDLGTSYKHK